MRSDEGHGAPRVRSGRDAGQEIALAACPVGSPKLRITRTALRTLVLAVFIVVLSAALLGVGGGGRAWATPEYAAQTGKDCGYCHQGGGGGPLTPEGQAFVDAGYQLPPSTTAAPDQPPTSSPGAPPATGGPPPTVDIGPPPGGGDGEASGMIVALPNWLRIVLLWAHLLSVVAWLGAIIFVHIVQTPSVAGQGIPRGYLKLAWPSITTVAVTGAFLTFNTVDTLAVLDDTRWGKILLAKIGLYLALVIIAALATFVISPRLRQIAEGQRRPAGAQEVYKEQGLITFAYQGRVYDVTKSRLWRTGRHAKRHEAWRDQTEALAGAPHGPEVFEPFATLEDVAPAGTPAPLKVFVALAYFNLVLVAAALLMVALW
jgi:predicted heme/steroid binding protein